MTGERDSILTAPLHRIRTYSMFSFLKKRDGSQSISFDVTTSDTHADRYSRFLVALKREVESIRANNKWAHNMADDEILKLQMLYLQGVKNIFLRDIFYDHVIAQIEDGDTVHLPEIDYKVAIIFVISKTIYYEDLNFLD